MMLKRSSTGFIPQAWVMGSFPRGLMRFGENFTFTLSFSRRFYPKRLTRMYTHFTFTLMAHCTSGAIRGSVSCSSTLRQGIEIATFLLINDFSHTVSLSPHIDEDCV